MNTMMVNRNKWYVNEDGTLDEKFIRDNEVLVPRGPIHTPISSADILAKFRERANSLGLKFKNERSALLKPYIDKNNVAKGGDRFIYIAEVEDGNHPDYALSVGFRNFGDKTLSFSGMCGASIFVCENGCCSSIVKPSKMRHTSGNVSNGFIEGKIDNIFSRFIEDKDRIHGQIAKMKGTMLSDDIIGKFVRSVSGKWQNGKYCPDQFIGATNLTRILADLENPAYNDRDDNSVFRLHNACTKVTTHNIKNPNHSIVASRYLNNIIMDIVDDSFVPLGDDVTEVIDAEVLD